MATYNKVILIGNLCANPELKYTPQRTAIANFSLAVNNGKDKSADFVNIEAWDKTAELCNEYLHKGSNVLIEGRLKQDRWEDEHGNKKTAIKIVAASVIFLEKKGDSVSSGSSQDTGDTGSGEAPF